jgi:hypothetical protein
MHRHLLPIGHNHLTFSGPDELTMAWRKEPKAVIDSLFAAVSHTLKLAAGRAKLQPGFMLVFHSHGSGMSYKAHIHGIITCGGVDAEGNWKVNKQYGERVLREDFRRLIIDELVKRIPAKDVSELQQTPEKQWKVYEVSHPEGPDALLGYFSRSHHGVVVKPDESFVVSENRVQFAAHHHSASGTTSLSRDEFLTRYFAHVPPKGVVTVRHYGLYATRYGKNLDRVRSMLESCCVAYPKEQLEDPIEHCPVCDHVLREVIRFSRDELPPVLRYVVLARGSPIGHGEIIPETRITA